ncbi:hypothetical protein CVT26_003125 [Gymnopilus dilepis]|uniref:Phosducin domain-containing protein n=1 Tax=Gymnopilus dilepis TaxID=231916 RepID=A0A409Y4K5_9AGAR|nr:hypothetical protein CVT26_003125 [Gymnopilus dilepis]
MAVNPDEDTELQVHGILPPKEAPPPSPSPPPSPQLDNILNEFSTKDLVELGEDAKDDEMERLIELHRQQRLAQERIDQSRARFGEVYPIGRDDYTREVTEASKVDEPDDDNERGTGVIVFLYKDGIPRSDRAFQHVRALAKRYPRTKFVSIVGDKCIPNLPDSRIPMFIVYRKGEIRQQFIAWGADRERRQEELEAMLLVTGALDAPEERSGPSDRKKNDEDEDDLDEDEEFFSAKKASASQFGSARPQKNIRSSQKKKGDDSDSDFEFDM